MSQMQDLSTWVFQRQTVKLAGHQFFSVGFSGRDKLQVLFVCKVDSKLIIFKWICLKQNEKV